MFVVTEPGAPAADLLRDAGLIEGPRNIHPGQGTSNRRFFFANSMLELVYVHDPQEAALGPGSRLRFLERATGSRASPFGIVVRADDGSIEVPFPAWRYYPEYFPGGQCFYVGQNSDLLEEPLCVCVPIGLDFSNSHLQKGNPDKIVTGVRIGVPVARPSPTLNVFAQCEGVSVRLNEPHSMELVFNDGRDDMSKDLRPDLPLAVRW